MFRTWFVNKGGSGVFGLHSGLVRLDVGTESQCVGDVVHDSESSISVSQTIGADFASVRITCRTIRIGSFIAINSSHQSLVGKIRPLRDPRCIQKRSFRCSVSVTKGVRQR